MNTKKNKIIGGIALLVVLVVLALRWFGFIPQVNPQSVPSAQVSPSAPSSTSPTPPSSSPAPAQKQLSPAEIQKRDEARFHYESHVFEMFILTPIIFYGEVVDTSGTPIEGAKIDISAVDSPGEGDSTYKRTSDARGLFSIVTHGMGLVINVSKGGYYKIKESSGMFGYSVATGGDYKPHTDSRSPAIFVLRKMGETDPLIMIQRYVKISKSGIPALINLTDGSPNGSTQDVQVQAWTHDEGIPPNAPRPYDWKCQITVPGGGLQPRTGGEFDFMAPTDGYQPSDEINMSANARPWNDSQSREYFLNFANGTYARIDFTMAAGGDHFFSITSYLNPTPGHRNLEYSPKP